MATLGEVFPWVPAIAAALETIRDPLFYLHTAAFIIFLALAIILILGYEPQIFPKPKFVRYHYKWNARMVALYALSTAVGTVIYGFGGMFWIMPGILSVSFFTWYMLWVLPVLFGWPGIWAAASFEILAAVIFGWLNIPLVFCAFAYDFFLGWFAWKTMGRDPSFRTVKSWLLFIGSYELFFAFFNTFGWGAQYVWWGLIPLPVMFMTRSAFNVIFYYVFSLMYPPLTIILYTLAKRYRLFWKDIDPQPYTREA